MVASNFRAGICCDDPGSRPGRFAWSRRHDVGDEGGSQDQREVRTLRLGAVRSSVPQVVGASEVPSRLFAMVPGRRSASARAGG